MTETEIEEFFQSHPQTGLGYHRTDVTFDDGNTLDLIVYKNGQDLALITGRPLFRIQSLNIHKR